MLLEQLLYFSQRKTFGVSSCGAVFNSCWTGFQFSDQSSCQELRAACLLVDLELMACVAPHWMGTIASG